MTFYFLTFTITHAEEYRIHGGDAISIEVMDHPEFTRTVTVRPDGMISYPLTGDIFARGFTCMQLSDIITEKIKPYVKGAPVTVTMTSFYYSYVIIYGAVNAPGMKTLYEPVDVLLLLGLAGGSVDPEPKKMKIIRSTGEVRNISLDTLWKHQGQILRNREEFMIYPGDIVYIYSRFRFKWTYLVSIVSVLSSVLFLVVFPKLLEAEF